MTDVVFFLNRRQKLEFLHDHVWAIRPSENTGGGKAGGKENEGEDGDELDDEDTPAKGSPDAPPGARQVTDFFKKSGGAEDANAGSAEVPTEA